MVSITNNTVSGFVDGVETPTLVTGASVKLAHNSLASNSGHGVLNGVGQTIDAVHNWWGSPTGPAAAGNPGGAGTALSGNALFDPWLCDGTDTSPAVGFQPNAGVLCGGTPPDTSINAQPPSSSPRNTASFGFSGSDDVTPAVSLTFECKLDAGAFSHCTNPQTYNGLAQGQHTFQVRAKNSAGRIDPTPATYTWMVQPETVAPQLKLYLPIIQR
jgi:hypothetical protein